ncbi:acyl-CoA Delta(11) desaturase isoform X2 [Solenopsis invicta]|uniref:acyl-CoA Delta(11) desaturase isoform X2 n=1 Tax=Solenopsis invicta TaxID=13686 RepID=UPI00193E3A96|nr:acyl-CoA Delta(11) desaturase isoform X2 [Solenopsis invicta]
MTLLIWSTDIVIHRRFKRYGTWSYPGVATIECYCFESDCVTMALKPQVNKELEEKSKFNRSIVWRNVIILSLLHLGALAGLYLSFTSVKYMTILFAIFLYEFSLLGISVGAHRLWSHRSYKAKWPLQLLLAFMNTVAFQDSVIVWAKDHRVHHKFSDTDADPHNPNVGFFFSHIGWLLCKKHPDVTKKDKTIDISDLESNAILAFQKKYYTILVILLCFVLPTVIPVVFWKEKWLNAYLIPGVLRHILLLNVALMINSIGHRYGYKPYDKYINASDNIMFFILSSGEGWHNYHHVFHQDYRAIELKNPINLIKMFIDFFTKIGWAYDLKYASDETVKKRMKRTGEQYNYN